MAKETNPPVAPSKKSDTAIKSHDCMNKWQDERYGKGLRLMNYSAGKNKWKCTVCATLRD